MKWVNDRCCINSMTIFLSKIYWKIKSNNNNNKSTYIPNKTVAKYGAEQAITKSLQLLIKYAFITKMIPPKGNPTLVTAVRSVRRFGPTISISNT